MKNILIVAAMYASTIIGAGFASGREIVRFFSMYYDGGFYGVILAGILFSALGFLVLDMVYTRRIRSYEEFIYPILGRAGGAVAETICILFMLCLFCIMNAGAARVLSQMTGLGFAWCAVLMGAICLVVILTDISGLILVNSVLTPFMIAGIILIGLYITASRDVSAFSAAGIFRGVTENWLFSSVQYVGYNGIMAIVAMSSLLPYLKTRRTGRIGGVLGGCVLCVAALVINSSIALFMPGSAEYEIPVHAILEKISYQVASAYSVILWIAMFLSAAISGFYPVNRLKRVLKVDGRLLAVIVCGLAVPISTVGFSNLISAIYPAFGYAGILLIAAILAGRIRGRRPRP